MPNFFVEKWRNFAREDNTGPECTQILKPFFFVFQDSLHWLIPQEKIFQNLYNTLKTQISKLWVLPRETNDTKFPNLLVYASKMIMTWSEEYGIKCGL
jgi:hypothetical protein